MVKVHRPDCSCWSCEAFPGPRAIQNLPLWLCDPVYTGKEDAANSNVRVEIAEAFFRNVAGDADGSSRPESVFRGQLRDGPWPLVLCCQVSRHADGFTTRYTSQKYRNEHHSHVSLMRRAAKAALALTEGAKIGVCLEIPKSVSEKDAPVLLADVRSVVGNLQRLHDKGHRVEMNFSTLREHQDDEGLWRNELIHAQVSLQDWEARLLELVEVRLHGHVLHRDRQMRAWYASAPRDKMVRMWSQ